MDIGVPREVKPKEGRVTVPLRQGENLTASAYGVRFESGAGGDSGAGD